jgi:hypothetical protein
MFGIARELEQIAVWFEPAVLILPGLAAVLLGLFVWLGGLGFKSALITIIGAVSGGFCGFFLGGRNLLAVIISAVVAMVIAIIFERIFIIIVACVLAAGLAFAVLAGPYIESKGAQSNPEPETKSVKVYLGAKESVEVLKKHIGDFVAETRRIFSRMTVYNWIIMAVAAAVLAVTGIFWQRLASAFCCAAFGTLLVASGMTLLLLYKGAVPISRMCQSWLFYVGVILAMTAFGMVEQLLLCERVKETLRRKKGAKETEDASQDWRGR